MNGAMLPPALYIPSTVQTPPVYSTDDIVEATDYVYSFQTERLLTVGNPYFSIADEDHPGKDAVPKVSANQYRVFRIRLPNPNENFDLPDGLLDPTKYRYVFSLVGIEVARGQPLNVGCAGTYAFNKGRDVENPTRVTPDSPTREDDNRVPVAFDPKQNQMLIVGCAPAIGEHWQAAKPCDGDTLDTTCPPIELVNTSIEDGDMTDIGFGAMDFTSLGANTSDVPMELVKSVSKYPDWIKMHTDPVGDSCFFFMRREQVYARRLWQHSGAIGEEVPGLLIGDAANKASNSAYVSIPSGSVVTSDSQLFNRPYWLGRSQGPNNGVLWGDDLFVTVADNTRNTIMHISTKNSDAAPDTYKPKDFKEFVRHVEEYGIQAIVRLCRVRLETATLASLYRSHPYVLQGWGISEHPLPALGTEDAYRFQDSQATRCPLPRPAPDPAVQDPWAKLRLWTVDVRDRLSSDLLRFSLGRKYLALPGSRPPPLQNLRKRPAPAVASTSSRTRSKRARR
nr:L1 [Columba livia papillomavirus 1]